MALARTCTRHTHCGCQLEHRDARPDTESRSAAISFNKYVSVLCPKWRWMVCTLVCHAYCICLCTDGLHCIHCQTIHVRCTSYIDRTPSNPIKFYTFFPHLLLFEVGEKAKRNSAGFFFFWSLWHWYDVQYAGVASRLRFAFQFDWKARVLVEALDGVDLTAQRHWNWKQNLSSHPERSVNGSGADDRRQASPNGRFKLHLTLRATGSERWKKNARNCVPILLLIISITICQ